MGYMGLEHWNLSDTAVDFFCDLEENVDHEKLISKQIDKDNGPYNTSGAVNVALLIEDGKIIKLSAANHSKLIKTLLIQLQETERAAWENDLDNWNYHVEAYKRLLDSATVNVDVI